MEINDYPNSPFQPNRAKRNQLQKASSEYEASQAKAQIIKPSGKEQSPTPLTTDKHHTLKGEIIDLRYQDVKIRLEPSGQVITARISGDVQLTIGQMAEFAVSDEAGGQLYLRYLPEDNALMNNIIHKALYASGLMTSEKNLAIVQELLNYQMPVDKSTILQLIKLTGTYPDASLSSLVLMHKNKLPINTSNIAQFEVYQQGMHQILSQLNSLIDNVKSIIPSNPTNNMAFNDINPGDIGNVENLVNLGEIENAVGFENSGTNIKSEDLINLYKSLLQILNDDEASPTLSTPNLTPNITPDMPIKSIFSDKKLIELQNSLGNINNQPLDESMTMDKLLTHVYDLYNNENIQSETSLESISLPQPILDAFVNMSAAMPANDKQKLIWLLKADAFKDVIAKSFHDRWTLSPDELAKENKVQDLFKRLDKDLQELKELTNNMSNLNLDSSQSTRTSINKLEDNLQFMRDLNELFLYLQLPMRLTKEDAHGDLYVFKRKNHKHSDSEHLNILLHLDMEHLGSMDIHMSMKNRQVNAVFYVEEDTYQIITKHIDELTNTLSNKGYNFQASTKVSEGKPDFITDVLQQNSPDVSSHRYSFDIRA